MFEKRPVKRDAPNWIACELCKDQDLHWQTRFVVAENEVAPKGSLELPELVLLCGDCSAVVKGEIDESEWKRRKLPANM